MFLLMRMPEFYLVSKTLGFKIIVIGEMLKDVVLFALLYGIMLFCAGIPLQLWSFNTLKTLKFQISRHVHGI